MRFLTRAVFVLALLGGLGYGSYAFGRYVLSDKLFGSSVVPSARSGLVVDAPSTVTRKTQYKGSTPRVEVQVMDAATAGPGPEPPSIDDLRKNAEELAQSRGADRTNQAPKTIVRRAGDEDSAGWSGSRNIDNGVRLGYGREDSVGERDEDRPRRKRRKRRKRTTDSSTSTQRNTRTAENTTARSSSGSDSSSNDNDVVTVLPETTSSSSGSSNDGGSNDSSRSRSVSSGSDGSSNENRPRRRRRRRTETSSESTPRRERVRERPSRTIESPVPQPESSDSPSPQPE
jgi:hypothetical protein